MKRLVLFLLFLLVPYMVARAEPFGFVASGGVWTDDAFETAGGGFLTGFIFPVDAGRGLYGRTQYHQFNIGDNKPVQSVDVSFLLTYNLGKRYDIFFHVGGEEYLSGADGTQFIGGFGLDKTIWTVKREGYSVPYTFKVFTDIAFVDNEFEPTGQHLKAFLGLVFYPSQK